MSFPAGYSDPKNKTIYGTTFGVQPTENPSLSPQQIQQYLNEATQFAIPVTNQPQHNAALLGFFLLKDTNNPSANETPVNIQCPSCRAQITTTTTYTTGSCAWLWCLILGVSGLLPFCFIPFFTKCAKDVIHTCPSCKAVCGRFNRYQQEHRVQYQGGHPNIAAANKTPVQMQCPSCRTQITTKIKYETGSCSWYLCLIISMTGAIPFAFLPFCMSCSKDMVHTCPHCMAVCGRYDRHINYGRHGCCAVQPLQ